MTAMMVIVMMLRMMICFFTVRLVRFTLQSIWRYS